MLPELTDDGDDELLAEEFELLLLDGDDWDDHDDGVAVVSVDGDDDVVNTFDKGENEVRSRLDELVNPEGDENPRLDEESIPSVDDEEDVAAEIGRYVDHNTLDGEDESSPSDDDDDEEYSPLGLPTIGHSNDIDDVSIVSPSDAYSKSKNIL